MTTDTEELLRDIHSFMDVAASDGLVCAGHDAADLFHRIDAALQQPDERDAEIARLREALAEAKKPRFHEPGYTPPKQPTHAYKPHPEYPWFCEDCGYPEHETLKHIARTALQGDGPE